MTISREILEKYKPEFSDYLVEGRTFAYIRVESEDYYDASPLHAAETRDALPHHWFRLFKLFLMRKEEK